jgi:small-conductance mechanosensitive channel
LSERAAYYIGRPEEMPVLQEALGEFAVGVASLPSGPAGSPRSLLSVEALMLSTASSAQQTAVALEIAQFLTNQEQATQLMRQAGHVPARRVTLETLARHGLVLKEPEPALLFRGFGDFSLNFDLAIWINQPQHTMRVRSDLYYMIFEAFKNHSIEIPFPQRDLNLKVTRQP